LLWSAIDLLLQQIANIDFEEMNVRNPLICRYFLDDVDMINRMNLWRYQLFQKNWEETTAVDYLKSMVDQLLSLNLTYLEAK